MSRSAQIIRYIAKLSKEMTFEEFDKMMEQDGDKTSAFGGIPVYVFGSHRVGQVVVEDIFANPEYYEDTFKNG